MRVPDFDGDVIEEPINITNTSGYIEEDADWSPDGQKIVFTRHSVGDNPQDPLFNYETGEICVLDLETPDAEPQCPPGTTDKQRRRAGSCLVSGRYADCVHVPEPHQQHLRGLRDEHGWHGPDEADDQFGVRRDTHVVSRWGEDRVRQWANTAVPALADECRRRRGQDTARHSPRTPGYQPRRQLGSELGASSGSVTEARSRLLVTATSRVITHVELLAAHNGVGGPVFRLAVVDPDGGLYVTHNGMSPTDGEVLRNRAVR